MLAVLLVAQASTASLPIYDTAAYCHAVVQLETEEAFGSIEQCLGQEARFQADLTFDWSNVSAKSRRHCRWLANMSGGSYSVLSVCLTDQLMKNMLTAWLREDTRIEVAPTCIDGRSECSSWERHWNSRNQLDENDFVLSNGSLYRIQE
jgi:hypothetical protein